jgi:hypothetical protein
MTSLSTLFLSHPRDVSATVFSICILLVMGIAASTWLKKPVRTKRCFLKSGGPPFATFVFYQCTIKAAKNLPLFPKKKLPPFSCLPSVILCGILET